MVLLAIAVASSSAARRRRCRTDHRHAALTEDVAEHAQHARLAGARDADHTDDTVTAARSLTDEHLLLAAQPASGQRPQ